AGFSPTLGARPLKRAVEEHLLTPLARTMVDADAPTGDQFLFVTAPHGAIEVQFVGLDEDQAAPEAEAPLTQAELEPETADLASRLPRLLPGASARRARGRRAVRAVPPSSVRRRAATARRTHAGHPGTAGRHVHGLGAGSRDAGRDARAFDRRGSPARGRT